jgi:hypothetical protein
MGNRAPRGKCPSCKKSLRLDLRGPSWVIPSHNLRVPGPNPECSGTGTFVMRNQV